MSKHRIAVIGGGISGITSSYILSRKHHITLFEANDYLGGHTNTRIVTDSSGNKLPVDTGFIVFNPENYPNFMAFIKQLEVPFQNSDMSFAYLNQQTGFKYIGPRLRDAIRAPERLLDPRFLRMLFERWKLNRALLSDIANNTIGDRELQTYLQDLKVPRFVVENYVLPLINAIWSKPSSASAAFPAATFANFFKNHGMLNLGKFPQWLTISGGSRSYVEAFKSRFPGKIHLDSPVRSVSRDGEKVIVRLDGDTLEFDKVIFATHADQTLKLLADPSPSEVAALSPWRYSSNVTTLHSDSKVLPLPRRYWASWNVIDSGRESDVVNVHYHMNRLQSLRTADPFIVSLNSPLAPIGGKSHYSTVYEHPIFSMQSLASQSMFESLNGQRNSYFCGAYQRYGFHEDGVLSALRVARCFNAEL